MRTFLVAAALSCALAGQSSAQSDTSHGDTNVTVQGGSIEEVARGFIGEVSAPVARRDMLPRWDGKVCAGVTGLNAAQGQFVVDRISQRAHEVGLEPGESGCKANLLIIFSDDARGLADALAQHERWLLGVRNHPEFLTTRGYAELDSFVASTQPVRWWHVAHTTTRDGYAIPEAGPGLGHVAGSGPIGPSPPAVAVRGTTIGSNTREDFRNAIIIVDKQRMNGLTVEPMADYLAMVSLAQLSPDADMSPYDTVLNLFGPKQVGHMTDWDLAYLQGLYHAIRNPNTLPYQERQMAQRMTRTMQASAQQPQPTQQ